MDNFSFYNQSDNHLNNNNNNNETHLPPGFRFHPTDEELITYYLIKKVLDGSFTCRAIAEVDLNKCEPWELPEKAKMGEKEWYFFSLRDRKYPTGLRTNRATEAGYWKATGKDREIYSSKTSALVGMKKTLVFYRGRAPKGEKSNWVMHEYRLEGKFAYHYLSRGSKDEWVISRVFQKAGIIGGGSGGGGSKKSRLSSSGASLYTDVSSPSATSLPPLLDTSPYAPNATMGTTTEQENTCSYDTKPVREHVPCFSTIATAAATAGNFNHNNNNQFSFGPFDGSGMSFGRNEGGLNGFPSLRSLQENLQLPPFFFSAVAPMHPSSLMNNGDQNWTGGQDHQKVERGPSRMAVGPTELDCMWTY